MNIVYYIRGKNIFYNRRCENNGNKEKNIICYTNVL